MKCHANRLKGCANCNVVDTAWREVVVEMGVEDGKREINKNYNYLLYT